MELDAALQRATTAVVVAGDGYDPRHRARNQVLGRVDDPAALRELAAAVRVGNQQDQLAIMSPSDPSIALLQGRELLGCIGVVGGAGVLRWPTWPFDAPATDPARLAAWLEAHTHGR